MKTQLFITLICFSLIAIGSGASAQDGNSTTKPDVELHVNSDLGLCDFDISPDLTQSEWKSFTKEGGNLIYVNQLSSAKPLGINNWDFVITKTSSDVDETTGAWNNTFHHPDSVHFLNNGSRTFVPGLRFRIGITDKLDAGIYYAPSQFLGANYGFLGLEAKYAFIDDTANCWAAAARLSYLTDANVKDFNFSVTALDLTASKTFFQVLRPYAGLSLNWNHGREVTDEVDLSAEDYLGVRGIVGIDFQWKSISLGYECMIGDGFNNRALKFGVSF